MMLNTDIHPDWTPPDIALFVGLVGTIQNAIGSTVSAHRRNLGDDVVQDLIAGALLVAMKSEHINQGLRSGDAALAFIEYEARLRAEIVDLPLAKKNFVASFGAAAGRA